jgi:hypothetical protein
MIRTRRASANRVARIGRAPTGTNRRILQPLKLHRWLPEELGRNVRLESPEHRPQEDDGVDPIA